MSKTVILTLVLVALASAHLTRNHDYWYTANKAGATSGIPYADIPWGYCDMKCTYLEKYYTTHDFVVIGFTESVVKPDFAACYVATPSLTGGNTTYALWSTIAKNIYYDDNCGKDDEDYYKLTQGANPKYKVSGPILGVGIGTEINY